MEELLLRVTQQAMNYAIRSGIAITANYAFGQSARLLRGAQNSREKLELQRLQQRLESRIKIIAPAIDMIELISARGNTSLETAVSLTKSIRRDIQSLGRDMAVAANKVQSDEGNTKSGGNIETLRRIASKIKQVLARIEDAVPLFNLAITTSGANLTATLPHTVSPSRLLQASTFITAGDTQYASLSSSAVQMGPTFTLSLYMLFAGHIRPENEEQVRRTTWKEVIHKTRVKLMRVPLDALSSLPDADDGCLAKVRSEEFAYQMLLVEDLDDGRVHDTEDTEPITYRDVSRAGIMEVVPVHQISKIFYADTGKILNIGGDGETNNPILLLRRDLGALPPRRMLDRSELEGDDIQDEDGDGNEEQSEIDAQLRQESRQNSVALEDHRELPTKSHRRRMPPGLDQEWLALEVYTEDLNSESESEASDMEDSPKDQSQSASGGLVSAMSNVHLRTPNSSQTQSPQPNASSALQTSHQPAAVSFPAIRTSLSLLEMMLRLLSLQQFQQESHLAIPDELLSFFLSEASSTTGVASGDETSRRRMRAEAVRDLGFDPYNESPIKRRGEEGIESRAIVPDADWVARGGAWARSSPGSNWDDGWPRTTGSFDRRTFDEGYNTQRLPSSPSSPLLLKTRPDLASRGASPASSIGQADGAGRRAPKDLPPTRLHGSEGKKSSLLAGAWGEHDTNRGDGE